MSQAGNVAEVARLQSPGRSWDDLLALITYAAHLGTSSLALGLARATIQLPGSGTFIGPVINLISFRLLARR